MIHIDTRDGAEEVLVNETAIVELIIRPAFIT